MSSWFRFRLAGEAEDSALCTVLRRTSMPGSISLAFCREPSYFSAERAGTTKHQTLVYQNRRTGRIAGIGSRSIRKLYVDGQEKFVGYLGNLRLLPEVRGGLTLVRGYNFLHSLHADGEVPYYLTTILGENTQAQRILESGRAGMPAYIPIGGFVTYLIPLRKKMVRMPQHVVQPCDEHTLMAACDCLREWNGRHQFAPVYTPEDLSGSTSLLPQFAPRNMYACVEEGRVAGTLGVWNQQSFKQMIVTDYSAGMKTIRPFYNGLAWLRGQPTLPDIGQPIRSVHAAFVSARNDDPIVFESLIDQACVDWSGCGHDYLLVGFAEGHTLGAVARRKAARVLMSKMYLVHWPDERIVLPDTGKLAHLEVATL